MGAKIALAQFDLQEGKNDEALRLARELRKEHPEMLEGVLIESQALANQKKLPEALRVMEQAQKAQPGSDQLPAVVEPMCTLIRRQYHTCDPVIDGIRRVV